MKETLPEVQSAINYEAVLTARFKLEALWRDLAVEYLSPQCLSLEPLFEANKIIRKASNSDHSAQGF